MKKLSTATAFSLVELTLALGIAAFCLVAVFALIPVAVLTNRNATSQTAAANIMAAVVADLRATPKACTKSKQFGIQFGGALRTLYFDGQGQSSCDRNGLQRYQADSVNCSAGSCSGSWSPPLQLRYQLNVTWNTSNLTGSCSPRAMRRSEGYVAGSCHGGKCEWIHRNVCRLRQELARWSTPETNHCRVRCPQPDLCLS